MICGSPALARSSYEKCRDPEKTAESFLKKTNRADASGTQCVILEKVRYPTDVRGWKKEDFVNGRQRTQKAESHTG